MRVRRAAGKKVHWRIAGQHKTPCGLPLNPQKGKDCFTNAPARSYDPADVTCKSCLGCIGLREFQSGWPPVRVLSASFSLEDKPESKKRFFNFRRLMTPEEVAVVTTLLQERVPYLLDEPDSKIVIAYRAARAATEKKKGEAGGEDLQTDAGE